MTQPNHLTLRGFDPRVRRAIHDLAKRERISLNKAALRLLEKGAGLGARPTDNRIGTSLDHLIGTWSDDEADELLESIRACEQLDGELWK
jgi:hypothetical protein